MASSNLSRTTAAAISTALLVGGASANALQTEIGDTTVSVGGFVKADFIHNFDENVGDLFFPNLIPVEGDPLTQGPDAPVSRPLGESGDTDFHARETRINFGTSTPTERGDVRTLIEIDFFRGATASGFDPEIRLRHAFVEWNGVMAGRYWSNFMPLVALPSTLDFHGPAGYVFVRQAQVRYTHQLPANNRLAVSVERPNSAIFGPVPGESREVSSIPDFTAQFSGRQGGLAYALSGVLTLPEVEGDIDDTTNGWGVSANAGYTFPTNTSIGGQATYVDGANRYMLGSAGFFNNAFVQDGSVETFSELGLMGYITQPFTPTVIGTLAVGYVDTDTGNDTDAAGILQDELVSVHANVQWRPVDRLMYGLEYQWGERELSNGNDNSVSRIQASAQWSF